LEVAYVGLKGTHLQLTQNINQPFVTGGNYGSTRPFATLPQTSPVIPSQCQTPNTCALNNINQVNSGGNSHYNALWATLNQHLSHGVQLLATYTYSKSLDYNSLSSGESLVIQNAYNPRGDYGLSEFDARHRVVASGFYSLPFKSSTPKLITGWQLGAITSWQTGNPLTPSLLVAPGPGISLTVRPDITGPVQTTGNPAQWFANKAVFVKPCVGAVCHPGNLGRDAITGPGFVNTDASLVKDTKLTEKLNLQFRTEVFDVFNHPNFGNPILTTTSGSFGQITSTRFPTGDFGSSRQLQFALKLMF
jgi:hypothetical protein